MFHNGSTYDYQFLIEELTKEFKGQFECLGENTEKYITFSVPVKKEIDNGKTATYKKSLLIALDLCQPHYQNLLNIYQKNFIVISAQIINIILTICYFPANIRLDEDVLKTS